MLKNSILILFSLIRNIFYLSLLFLIINKTGISYVLENAILYNLYCAKIFNNPVPWHDGLPVNMDWEWSMHLSNSRHLCNINCINNLLQGKMLATKQLFSINLTKSYQNHGLFILPKTLKVPTNWTLRVKTKPVLIIVHRMINVECVYIDILWNKDLWKWKASWCWYDTLLKLEAPIICEFSQVTAFSFALFSKFTRHKHEHLKMRLNVVYSQCIDDR